MNTTHHLYLEFMEQVSQQSSYFCAALGGCMWGEKYINPHKTLVSLNHLEAAKKRV